MTIFVNFVEKISSFWQFFDSQMAIFRSVSSEHYNGNVFFSFLNQNDRNFE